ncbi:MAG: hypothetical protein ACJ8KF_12485 [Chthoniobacterales bacterium]
MKFIGGNGDQPSGEQPDLAHVYNAILEELCLLRADMNAVHGILQFLGFKQGIPVEKLQELRLQMRNQSYDKVCADVLAQLRGTYSDAPPPPEA